MDAEEEEMTAGENDNELHAPDDDELRSADDNEPGLLGRSLDADSILDALVPPSIDWRGTVRRYPLLSVTGLGLVGYLVGRAKGAAIMTGLSAGLSGALMRQLGDVFEGDLFDFD